MQIFRKRKVGSQRKKLTGKIIQCDHTHGCYAYSLWTNLGETLDPEMNHGRLSSVITPMGADFRFIFLRLFCPILLGINFSYESHYFVG